MKIPQNQGRWLDIYLAGVRKPVQGEALAVTDLPCAPFSCAAGEPVPAITHSVESSLPAG